MTAYADRALGRRRRIRWRVRPASMIRHSILLGVIALIIFPFVWVILMSFRPYRDLTLVPPTFLPRVWTLDNYRALFSKDIPLLAYYANSLYISAVVVPAVVFITCLAGYGFARLRFPGRGVIFWILISTIFLPLEFPRLFTVFELTWNWQLTDTRTGLILPYLSMGLVVYIFIMRNIFLDIPQELEDAARIDGCSVFGTFFNIMLPLSASGLVMVTVLCFLGVWGEFLYATTLTHAKALTLPVALLVAVSETQGDTVMTTLATAYVLAMIPPLVIYLTLNRWFRAGLAHGALKF